ncbi:MAG: hypothetical protein MJ158_01435 [Alphaproteobacteria bacterium]|nr:hypothetical protein [Alphaproteobacteria bacterium]
MGSKKKQRNNNMEELATSLIDNGMQCWTCPIFDKLFAIISNAGGIMYQQFTTLCIIIFCILLSFYVLNIVWQNIKSEKPDVLFKETLKPIIIKSLFALTLLGMGAMVPRLISIITFEPTAQLTLAYSKAMLPENYEIPEYIQTETINDNAIFRPELRETITRILETSVANFQVYVKTGLAIIDSAFSFKYFLFGNLLKHMIVLFIGLFITYNFAKLFVKYSFCFMDIIVAMAMFAFLFPLALVLFIFKDAKNAPDWLKSMGKDLGSSQIKHLINAIVGVAASILTYTVIILIIRGYFTAYDVNIDSLQTNAQSIFNFDLDNSDVTQITFFGCIVLVYVITYLANQIPQITSKILEAFNVSAENSLSKEMGDNIFNLTKIIAKDTKEIIGTIVKHGATKGTSDTQTESKKTDGTEKTK